MKKTRTQHSFKVRQTFALLVLTILFVASPLPSIGAIRQDQIDFSELEKIAIEEMKEKNTPGAAIAIVRGDKVIFARGLGLRSIETNEPVTTDTLFRLGSTTKMFTGAAIAALASQGRIKLDSPISNYVRGLSPKISQLTAHQLVSNTAGLRDSITPIQTDDDEGLGRMIRGWKDDVFFTEPGRIYSYSSAGYWLAGLVIEEVCGTPYADVMNELLFKPVGMNRTTFRPLVAMTYSLALGHNIQSNGSPAVIRPAFNNLAMWPAGSIFSNVDDLSRWVIALMNDGRLEGREILPSSVVRKITERHAPIPGDSDSHYGYGLMEFKYRGVRFLGHGGFSRGYGSMIQMAPRERYGVIIITNKSGETLPKTLNKAMELGLKLDSVSEATAQEIVLSEKEMEEFVGAYSHPPAEWRIFVREGRLLIKQDDGEYALKKTATDRFVYGNSGENEIVFARGRDGRVDHLFNGLYAARKIA